MEVEFQLSIPLNFIFLFLEADISAFVSTAFA